MGQFASDIHAATAAIPAAPATDPAQLLDGPELLAIFARVEAAVAALELRAAGSRIQRGAGAPDNALGNDQDLYVNTQNGDLWGKDAGVWALLLNLKGAPGKDAAGGGGKSAYELAVQQGFQGSVDQWLASLGRAGAAGQSAYLLAVQQGFQGSVDQWVASLKGEPGKAADPAVLGAGSVGNEQLAADVKVGSLSAAGNAYPAADRAGLTTVERFLVWLGGKVGGLVTDLSNLAGRVKTLEDRPVSTGGGSTAPAYTLPQASATQLGGVKGVGTGLTGNVVVNADGSLSAPVGSGTGLPAGGTAGQVLAKTSSVDGAVSWASPGETYTAAEKSKLAGIRTLVAGANVTFDDTTPGVRTLNAAAPGTTAAGVTAAQLETVRTTLSASTTQTGAYTLAATDAGNQVPISSASSVIVTVPTDSAVALAVGTVLEISQEGPGRVTVTGAGGVTVTGFSGLKTPGQYAAIGLRKIAANTWRVTGGTF